MAYRDFLLQIYSVGSDKFGISVLDSLAGDGHGSFSRSELPTEWFWHRETATNCTRDVALPKAQSQGATPQEIGARLYQVIFRDRILSLFEHTVRTTQVEKGEGLRLKIFFLNPEDPEVRFLQGLPWELIWTEAMGLGFLSLRDWISIVRSLPVDRPAKDPEIPERFQVLAALAEPSGVPKLNLEQELQHMKSAGVLGEFVVDACRVRLAELGETLKAHGPFHTLHFLGHGGFRQGCGEGILLLEGADGARDEVTGASFAEKLQDHRTLQLIVLNSCKSSQAPLTSIGHPFGSVAAALVHAGFPAVLAMQTDISDAAAIAFSRTFYKHLAQRESIEVALVKARHAVFDLNCRGFEWGIPSLFLRAVAEEDKDALLVKRGIDLFRSGDYTTARQHLKEALSRNPRQERARLFEILSRLATRVPLSLGALGEIDTDLQKLLKAADSEVAGLARLSLGILRCDSIAPRRLRVSGIGSADLFTTLERSKRTPFEKEIARALGASRNSMILFNLQE